MRVDKPRLEPGSSRDLVHEINFETHPDAVVDVFERRVHKISANPKHFRRFCAHRSAATDYIQGKHEQQRLKPLHSPLHDSSEIDGRSLLPRCCASFANPRFSDPITHKRDSKPYWTEMPARASTLAVVDLSVSHFGRQRAAPA
jgi:hypothetical protein